MGGTSIGESKAQSEEFLDSARYNANRMPTTSFDDILRQSGANWDIGATLAYDPSGRAISTGSTLSSLSQSDTSFQNYIDMLQGKTFNPMASRLQSQTQNYYAGMGMLGTPAAATGMAQTMSDFELEQLSKLGGAIQGQAGVRQSMMSGAQNLSNMQLERYIKDMQMRTGMVSQQEQTRASLTSDLFKGFLGNYQEAKAGEGALWGAGIGALATIAGGAASAGAFGGGGKR